MEISFIYWSDRYARNFPSATITDGDSAEFGGIDVFSGVVKNLQNQAPQSLTIAIGNELVGTPAAVLSKGSSEVDILDRIGVDIYVPGQRDFDYGWEELRKNVRGSDFFTLLSNVYHEKNNVPIFIPDTVLNINGVSVGIIGIINPRFTMIPVRDQIVGLATINPITAANEFVAKRNKDCDLLVAVTALGWIGDSTLAAYIPELDIIIGGGDRVNLDPPRKVNGALIVQGGAYGKHVGFLSVDVDTTIAGKFEWNNQFVDVIEGAAVPAPGILQAAKTYAKKIAKVDDKPISHLKNDWNLSLDQPCNLGQWVVDATWGVEPRTKMAVIDKRDIAQGLNNGPISERDLLNILPYNNSIIVFQVNGSYLKYSIDYQLRKKVNTLSWGGLYVEAVGDSLVSANVLGKQIVDDDLYLILTTGSVWGQLEDLMGLDPQRLSNHYFQLPNLSQREWLLKVAAYQKVIEGNLDQRWTIR